jgi:1-aminocyclopropane-1-carboxylate deaminase/D-cysteine desulfhydrase-like pyridoxal-dependent ACC family enzyme
MSVSLYRDETPVEEYDVNGVRVYVKREDLFGIPPSPPLGKLRGLRTVLTELHDRGVSLVGCWDTRVSRLGEGLASGCLQFKGMRAIVSYPTKTGAEFPPSIAKAQRLGAQVLALRGNHVSICYSQARVRVQALGGHMLPFGLECEHSVTAIAQEASRVPVDLLGGTLVLCCGSGVTLAGLLAGLQHFPDRIVGISSGRSVLKIRACLTRYLSSVPKCVEVIPARMPYDQTPNLKCPFPSHPNYDLKAWEFVVANIEKLKPPVLFWNIGA